MNIRLSSQVRLLSLAFLFIFTGFNGIQQYITTFFSQTGLPTSGFVSLILIYLFFILSDPFSAIVVSKYGSKKSMMIGVVCYFVFIFTLSLNSLQLVYIVSALLGFGASLLWTGQNSYLIRATTEDNRGTNAGFFSTILFLGSAVGVILVGFLIDQLSYQRTFLLVSALPAVGFLLISKLDNLKPEKSGNHLLLLRKAISSKTAWRLSTIWFSVFFIYGLAIGLIPIEIKSTFGIAYVGSISSIFYIAPIFLSLAMGKLSDSTGRKKILLIALLINFIGLVFLYFSHQPIILLVGIILIAIYFSIVHPLTLALVGDVTTKKNLEYLIAFFWMIENVGVVAALVLSSFIQTKTIYLISIVTLFVTLCILIPILKEDFKLTRQRLAKEV